MDKLQIMLKTCDFYKKESDKILAESLKCKTNKQKEENLKKLISIKSKIIFEIEQINKIIRESENSSGSDGEEWKDG